MSNPVESWPYLVVFERMALALAIGLFIGMERERRGKDAGLRTFGFAALLGSLGGLLGDTFAILSIVLLGVLVVFLNVMTIRRDEGTELTTSIALFVTGFTGVLSGQGHTLEPAAIGVITAALLAWKEPMSGFSLKLSDTEFRSAILLGILAFVIYPALPQGSIDPWGALEPRAAWVTVILIAGIGFVNYVLWKLYGDRGIELTGFLGGLVNSSVTTRELAARARETSGGTNDVVYRGILLAMAAMVIRNAVLMAILGRAALISAAAPFAAMLLTILVLAFLPHKRQEPQALEPEALELNLESPFSLSAAFRFGLILVAIQIAGVLAQFALGDAGVYATSLIGGFFSSASAVAAAAALAAHGTIATQVAGTASVIASLTSVAVNVPLAIASGNRALGFRLGRAVAIVALAGLAGTVLPLLG